METILNYSDEQYKSCVNYEGSLYNFPITLEVKKTKRSKESKRFILSCGTSDCITVKVRKGVIYVLGKNRGLSYISLTVIDIKSNWLIDTLYWDNNQIEERKPDLLDKSTNFQIRYLSSFM
jgi:hypothetical protein